MRGRSVVALALLSGLALAACRTDRELTEPDPVPVTEERLAAALVEVTDLTGGFTTVDGPGTPINDEVLPEHKCDDALKALEPKESVSRDFTGTDTRLTHSVSWFPGKGGAVEQVFRDVAADCASVVAEGSTLAIRTGPLDFGVLSDNTLAIRIELEPESGVIQERDLIFRREGDLVSLLRLEGPRPSDKALLDAAARVAIGYLGLLHDDTT